MPGYHDINADDAPHNGQTFYIYKDADGQTHVVDQKALIPQAVHNPRRVVMPASKPKPLSPTGVVTYLPSDIGTKALNILRQSNDPASVTAVTELLTQTASPEIAKAAQAAMTGAPPPVYKTPDMPLMQLTLTAAAVLGVAWIAKPVRGALLKLGMSVVGVTFMGSVYLNWMAQHAGMGHNGPVTPASMVQQAQDNAELMRKSMESQQHTLDQIHE